MRGFAQSFARAKQFSPPCCERGGLMSSTEKRWSGFATR